MNAAALLPWVVDTIGFVTDLATKDSSQLTPAEQTFRANVGVFAGVIDGLISMIETFDPGAKDVLDKLKELFDHLITLIEGKPATTAAS
jgi:hypothetical protein